MKPITTLSARSEAIGPLKIASRPEALQIHKGTFSASFHSKPREKTSHTCDLTSRRDFTVLGLERRSPEEKTANKMILFFLNPFFNER